MNTKALQRALEIENHGWNEKKIQGMVSFVRALCGVVMDWQSTRESFDRISGVVNVKVWRTARIERRRSYHSCPGREERGCACASFFPLIRDTLQHAKIGPGPSQARWWCNMTATLAVIDTEGRFSQEESLCHSSASRSLLREWISLGMDLLTLT